MQGFFYKGYGGLQPQEESSGALDDIISKGSGGSSSQSTSKEIQSQYDQQLKDLQSQMNKITGGADTDTKTKIAINNPWKYFLFVGAFIFGAFIAKMTKKR